MRDLEEILHQILNKVIEMDSRLENLESGQERLRVNMEKGFFSQKLVLTALIDGQKEVIPQLKQVQKKVSEMERVVERNAFDITLLKAETK